MKQEFQTDFLEDKEESDQVNLSLGVFAHRTLTLTLYQKAVLFPPNGKMLVTAGVDGAVRLWDCTLLLRAGDALVLRLGSYSGNYSGPTLKEKAALLPASPKEIASMHISPDGLLVCYLHLQGSFSCVPG